MNKLFLFAASIFFALQSLTSNAQCYVQMDDASGFNTAPYQADLDTAACELIASFPDTFQSQFKVFSFGFYVDLEYYDGYSYPQAFSDMKAQVAQLSPYYLLIGRQSDHTGIYTKFWVDVKLPETESFECLDENKLNGLIEELNFILNQKIDFPSEFAEREKEAINKLVGFLLHLFDCCGGTGNRQFSTLDATKLKIKLRLGGEVEANGQTYNSTYFNTFNNAVGFITEASDGIPSMPVIGFELLYEDELCIDNLKAVLEIKYLRDCQSYALPEGNTVTTSIENVSLKTFYLFSLGIREAYEMNYKVIQGGRASIKIYEIENPDTPIKTLNFTVKGLNPSVFIVFKYLDAVPYNEMWFLKKMVMHESGSYPTNNIGAQIRQFKYLDLDDEDLKSNWDADSRCPLLSFDCGSGMSQLTPAQYSQALWDWRANIHGAYHVLYSKKSRVLYGYHVAPYDYTGIVEDAQTVLTWNENNLENEVEHLSINYGGITWKTAPSILLSNTYINQVFTATLSPPGERSLLDACLILAYNGYGGNNGRNFCYIDNDPINPLKPKWFIDDNQNNYVKRIAEQQIPQE